jgi:hypothetical protein
MIVVHDQQQQRNADDPPERSGRKRPLVDGNAKYLEDYVAKGDLEQDQ